MNRTVTIGEAVRDIARLLAAVEAGETIEIRRDGSTIATITPAQKPATGLRSRGFRKR